MKVSVDNLLIITGEGKDRQVDCYPLDDDSAVHVTYAFGKGLQKAQHVTLGVLLESYIVHNLNACTIPQ